MWLFYLCCDFFICVVVFLFALWAFFFCFAPVHVGHRRFGPGVMSHRVLSNLFSPFKELQNIPNSRKCFVILLI